MFDKRIRTAIEIKVDRADAKRESLAKVRAWRQVTHRFFYNALIPKELRP